VSGRRALKPKKTFKTLQPKNLNTFSKKTLGFPALIFGQNYTYFYVSGANNRQR